MNTKSKGNIGENIACKFLEDKNFKILDRNFYFKGGEIDIIAYKNNTLHFIEVKSGFGFEPVYNITQSKIKRIIKGAYIYMRQKGFASSPFCIDAIIVKGESVGKYSVEYFQNLTLL